MNARHSHSREKWKFAEEEQAQLLEEFQQRKESAREFAVRHGVAASTLHRWARATSKVRRRAPIDKPIFQEVAFGPALAPLWTAEVRLPDGTQLRWNRGADAATLENLLHQLRRPC